MLYYTLCLGGGLLITMVEPSQGLIVFFTNSDAQNSVTLLNFFCTMTLYENLILVLVQENQA